MHAAKTWLLQSLGQQATESLKNQGYDAVYVADAEAARAAVLERIPAGATIGFGGSWTLSEIDLFSALESGGFELINPPSKKLPDDKPARDAVRRRAALADVAIASANAITLDGEIVSTDQTGNRLALYLFGPKATILVVGANKIVPDIISAQERIREVAAVVNARRLDRKSDPCYTTGVCDDAACTSRERICNATVILHKKPMGIDRFSVIVVGQELGF